MYARGEPAPRGERRIFGAARHRPGQGFRLLITVLMLLVMAIVTSIQRLAATYNGVLVVQPQREQDAAWLRQEAAAIQEFRDAEALSAAGGEQQQQEGGGGQSQEPRRLRSLLPSIAVNKTIIVAIANDNHRDFVLNWVHHVRAAGLSNFVVGAMDHHLFEYLTTHGIPCYRTEVTIAPEALQFRGTEFNRLGRYKARVIKEVTGEGYSILFSDIDAIFLRDPIPFLNSYPKADILCSSDHPISTTGERGGLEDWREASSAFFNIGFLLVRPSAHQFAQVWHNTLLSSKVESTWDQGVFNALLKPKLAELPGNQRNLFLAWDGSLKMGLLPVTQFCSGYTYFVRPVPDPAAVYVVHATKVTSEAKRHRLREAGLWQDEPSYFKHPFGFMSIEVDGPHRLLDAARVVAGNGRNAQMALVNHQLKQVEHMLGWSSATGRAAILPKLWSSVDCVTAIKPGATLELFKAPADQVLNFEAMASELGEREFGAPIAFRDAAFLERPRALQLAADTLVVEICEAPESPGCTGASGELAVEGGVARLKPGLSYDRIAALLANVTAKVVHVRGVWRATGGFKDAERQARFRQRLGKYAGVCCCNPWEQDLPRVQYTLGDAGGAVPAASKAVKRPQGERARHWEKMRGRARPG